MKTMPTTEHRPAQQPQGGYSEATLKKAVHNNINSFSDFLFVQMFQAAAPENVRCLISQKDQTRLTIEDSYNVFYTEASVEADKKISTEDAQPQQPEPDLTAYCQQPKPPQCQGSQQGYGGQSGYRGNRS